MFKRVSSLLLLAASFAVPPLFAEERVRFDDPQPVGESSCVYKLEDGTRLRIDVLDEDIVRLRRTALDRWTEGGLHRYGILPRALKQVRLTREGQKLSTKALELTVDAEKGQVRFVSRVSGAEFTVEPKLLGAGYQVSFSLGAADRIYGLGDSSRKGVQRRPGRYPMWISDRSCGAPSPMFLDSIGFGALNCSTWKHEVDVGQNDPAKLSFEAAEGDVDFCVFVGKGLPALLEAYTRLTGRPRLLPVWGYGLQFVANQEINDYALCQDARNFRLEKIPCDTIGLEPGWMDSYYNLTTRKYWNRDKFHIPYWSDSKGFTFIGALENMGFKLSLWSCCEYDLTRWEEECVAGKPDEWQKLRKGKHEPRVNPPETWWEYRFPTQLDEEWFDEGVQPWFEHWKKFIRQGAVAFKLDACNQYGEHPNRQWYNGMTDREAHNLYPSIYAKQMARGYEGFTGKRAMINSAAGYVGVQQYVATWAGDTGGRLHSLVSAQCHGLSGHVNTSCDLDVSLPDAIHFGFLQAWTFHDNWDCFLLPWYLKPATYHLYANYARLRYRLFPYIYTTAAEASRTGMPIVRPLALEYPENPEYDTVKGTYLLGHDLLVCAFDEAATVPPGVWYEWRSGRKVVGPCVDRFVRDGEMSGGLYVRAGAIIPTWKDVEHVERGWQDEVEVLVWPRAEDGESAYELYEDEGNDLKYLSGEYALTHLTARTEGGKVVATGASKRRGTFEGAGEVKFTFKVMP